MDVWGNCSVIIDIEEDMEAPVFFYYEVREFYQTHRLYLRSREEDQLTGKDISNTENCKEENTGMRHSDITDEEDFFIPRP